MTLADDILMDRPSVFLFFFFVLFSKFYELFAEGVQGLIKESFLLFISSGSGVLFSGSFQHFSLPEL